MLVVSLFHFVLVYMRSGGTRGGSPPGPPSNLHKLIVHRGQMEQQESHLVQVAPKTFDQRHASHHKHVLTSPIRLFGN